MLGMFRRLRRGSDGKRVGTLAGRVANPPYQFSDAHNVEAAPPSYVVRDGVRVEAHRLLVRNADAVEKMASLIINHTEKLGLHMHLRAAEADSFVIGYLAGAIDALCQNGGVRDEYQRTGMLERLYAHVFDRGFASEALGVFLLQQQSNSTLQEGMVQGGEDLLAFING